MPGARLRWMALVLLVAALAAPGRLLAADDIVATVNAARFQRLIEIAGGVQLESRSGWLTREKSGLGFAGAAHLYNPMSGDGLSFFEFNFGYSEFRAANAGGFPFVGGEKTKFLALGLIPSIGFLPMKNGNLFFGIGPMQYTVWQDGPLKQQQTYGTFLWQVGGRYSLSDRWSALVKLNYSDLEATVNGQETFTANIGLRLELAFTLL